MKTIFEKQTNVWNNRNLRLHKRIKILRKQNELFYINQKRTHKNYESFNSFYGKNYFFVGLFFIYVQKFYSEHFFFSLTLTIMNFTLVWKEIKLI